MNLTQIIITIILIGINFWALVELIETQKIRKLAAAISMIIPVTFFLILLIEISLEGNNKLKLVKYEQILVPTDTLYKKIN